MACDPNSADPQRCSICLEDLSQVWVRGFLPCSHAQFCYTCIFNWAKVSNTCPLCKSEFSLVMKWEGRRLTSSYELVERRPQTEAWEELTPCEVCHDAQHEDILMLCDDCDRGFHTLCVGLISVPDLAEWFCDRCLQKRSSAERRAQQRAVQLVASLQDAQSQSECKRRRRLRRVSEDDEDILEGDVLVI